MSTESDIEETLQDAWDSAQEMTGIYTNQFKVRFMGWVKGKKNIKNGRYLQIQNFINLPTAKKRGNHLAFRVTFRSMYLKKEDGHYLEVVEWTGGNGTSVEDTTTLLSGPNNLVSGEFKLMMCDALRKSVSTQQPF